MIYNKKKVLVCYIEKNTDRGLDNRFFSVFYGSRGIWRFAWKSDKTTLFVVTENGWEQADRMVSIKEMKSVDNSEN